jgi:beta-galactosidase
MSAHRLSIFAFVSIMFAMSASRAFAQSIPAHVHFPQILRSGTLNDGHAVHYLLNYSAAPAQVTWPYAQGKDLLSGGAVSEHSTVALPTWGVAVVEEGAK